MVTVRDYRKFLSKYNGAMKCKPYSKMKKAELEAEVARLKYKVVEDEKGVRFVPIVEMKRKPKIHVP